MGQALALLQRSSLLPTAALPPFFFFTTLFLSTLFRPFGVANNAGVLDVAGVGRDGDLG
jgi:hypothetical protein